MKLEAKSKVHIESEMSESYMDYAMSVIVSRALPDARDGLKPVHRRILYAMHEMGMRAGADFKKSARIVGEVLGKFHPHGDAAVYDTMVRLVQDFSMRSPLLEGQGNFGSIDGDGPAAMRYTEVRMASLGEEMMLDIARDTVPFIDNFDGTLREPIVLPSRVPNLLVNGASGIAVGMATSIPPHNLGEVCDALDYMLANWPRLDEISTEEIMQFIQGPDFPTGGLLYQHPDGNGDGKTESLSSAYQSGRGKITIRSRLHTETLGNERKGIVITQLPFQVNKSTLIERIATLARDGRLEGLADLRDESDRTGLRLVIELGKNVKPEKIIPLLYRNTPLQDTFSIILLALVEGVPRLLPLKRVLSIFLEHRLVVLRRRSVFELRKAEERAHILAGLLIALSKLDAVIDIIRRSRKTMSARQNLRKALKISEIQSRAILELPLGRLVALERRNIRSEYQDNRKRILELETLLGSDEKQRAIISEELSDIKRLYQDQRRTHIAKGFLNEGGAANEMLPQHSWLTLSASGKIGCIIQDEMPRPNTRNKDTTRWIRSIDLSQPVYAFTARGLVARMNPREIPSVQHAHLGQNIAYFSSALSQEIVVSLLGDHPDDARFEYLTLVTKKGLVKRIQYSSLAHPRRDAFPAIKLSHEDRLVAVIQQGEEDDLLLVNSSGRMIRFAAQSIRPSGLAAGGVQGMRLKNATERVISAGSIQNFEDTWLSLFTVEGLAGRIRIEEIPRYQRGAQGLNAMKLLPNSKRFGAAAIGKPTDQILLVSNQGRGRIVRIRKTPVMKRGSGKPTETITLREREQIIHSCNLTTLNR
ncbi:MAG: DNA topoisomerase 4 subunit A [Chloroflexi bacterium]|nr:DNA topoisomerase 4 subunit A [Chloroflexota bacterium]